MKKIKELLDKLKKWLKKSNANKFMFVFYTFVTIALVIGLTFAIIAKNKDRFEGIEAKTYVEFSQMMTKDTIEEVQIDFSSAKFTFTDAEKNEFQTDNPKVVGFKEQLLTKGIKVEEVDDHKKERAFDKFVASLKFMLIMTVLLYFVNVSGLGGSFSKKYKAIKPNLLTLFVNVAGNEEAKEELYTLVDFLKNPKKFTNRGAKMPRGYLLIGPPGTGKTYITKAVANEANVPFFTISGSDFVEIYAGVGAKRVRAVFDAAKECSPSIIFIDEVDAIAGKRGKSGNSENDQALNQLLVELDGFDKESSVVVIAATNRVDMLDEAFIRPGRFDKHITINLPDIKDRTAILKEHLKGKPLADDVNIETLAQMTIGMSGAGIEVLVNEATIISIVAGRETINFSDFDDAQYKMLMKGSKKKNREQTEHEKRLLSWHEAAHTIATKLLTNNDVPKVTIVGSTAGHGGATFSIPKKMGLHTKRDLYSRVKVLYAGRIAEYLLTNDEMEVTTGAVKDISDSAELIESMIKDYGMSETFGMVKVTNMSVDIKSIEAETVALSKQLYNETLELLQNNLSLLEAMAEALFAKETLLADEIDEIMENNKGVLRIE